MVLFVELTFNVYFSCRNELEEYAEQQEQNRRRETEAKDKAARERLARKYHYLISTHVMPGVFNSPFQPYVKLSLS